MYSVTYKILLSTNNIKISTVTIIVLASTFWNQKMYRNQHFGNGKCMSINILEYYSTNQDILKLKKLCNAS